MNAIAVALELAKKGISLQLAEDSANNICGIEFSMQIVGEKNMETKVEQQAKKIQNMVWA